MSVEAEEVSMLDDAIKIVDSIVAPESVKECLDAIGELSLTKSEKAEVNKQFKARLTLLNIKYDSKTKQYTY